MIINADCLEWMKSQSNDSIDCIICDPPYGLKFMGKKWDHGLPPNEIWQEALRISKPGTWLLAFGGTRTYHRLTCSIEDAGWEIRDCIMWIYGSGFPKSHNISKAIDKDNGKKINANRFCKYFDDLCISLNISNKQIDDYFGFTGNAFHFRAWDTKDPRFPCKEVYYKLKTWLNISDEFDEIIEEAEREIIAKEIRKNSPNGIVSCGRESIEIVRNISLPSLELSKKFKDYGTALKPAYEPILLAMKPIEGTFAQNAEKWGVAGINIEESRVDGKRWPANLLLDSEAGAMLDEQSEINASRFFYTAKASSSERQECKHPTIKPKKLIEYLVKLVLPPGKPIILDPFMGSGTCGIVCKELGIDFIGIEKEKEYFEEAKRRIDLSYAPQCVQLELDI